ncbi:RNA polymerase sigma factor [Falsibacillus albus]|uniref:RNA polymerase sigma factor n=1 Tax=Falsibacillus albus TaxID=2478915 RepID=A0A3L7K101_9BACI|nr:RNA polymerase sigma factor [Falsibacillus albus]RLQ96265.1 RNA polymerase sigma factor [Falsibacillus albus]
MTKNELITEWFNRYSDDIYHYFIYRMGTMDVDDYVQDVFVRAMKGLDKFQDLSSPKTWLYRIAMNLAIDEDRKKRRNSWRQKALQMNASLEGNHFQRPEQYFDLRENNVELYNAILSLKSSYRDVVILRGINELSVTESAIALDWKESKVRSTYHRAKLALQKKLGGERNG